VQKSTTLNKILLFPQSHTSTISHSAPAILRRGG